MVERLRRSIENLEPPTCPNCHIEMNWYRSIMVSASPLTINHYFTCPNCSRLSEAQSIIPHIADIPPGKLSAPLRRFQCAA